jgi:hypothetical protein
MKNYFVFFVLAGFIFAALSGCEPQQKVFTVTDKKGTTDKTGPEVIKSVNIEVNIPELKNEKNVIVELPLPDNKSLKLVMKRLDKFENERYAWYGEVEKDTGSFALISITQKAISGRINTSKGDLYMINYIGNGVHRIDQIDESALPERNDDDIEVPPSIIEKERDCPDPATQVDILVLYTADAEAGAGGAEGMEAFIYQCIYFTNLSYQNSNVNLTMYLVHFERIDYTETGDENIDLDRLRATSDGFMDNAHTLRDAHGADLVSLIVETMGGCGLAYRQYPVTAGFASSGFSVVKRTCAAANLSFAHETAHNMGARHDCANSGNSAGPNHGHLVSVPADGSGLSWRTVMSYNACSAGSCTRIAYFSNPLLTYSPTASPLTDPMGTAAVTGSCTNDNTSVLNAAASIVANFRCSSPGVPNVWMRDTWNDTGLEPDPATAAEAMWRSPYIWIRSSAQDPAFLHQHEHENPVMGTTNWIYVKMHNGGVADNGTLEIYYALASLSLTWPGAWTLLTSVPVAINASSTRIIEIPWSSLPGEGHYCMVARWNSVADPITFTETTDIGYNTRQNNNIVWRNLNIVGMDSDADEKVETFFIQNVDGRTFSIRLTNEALYPKLAFIKTGRIFLKLSDEVYSAWRNGGAKGSGIKDNKGEIEIIAANATLDNITIKTTEKMKAIIRFVKNKQTKPDRYYFTIEQIDTKGKAGGVSYEIYTYKR